MTRFLPPLAGRGDDKSIKAKPSDQPTDFLARLHIVSEQVSRADPNFIQLRQKGREIHYRGDGTPVGYKQGSPLPKHVDELLTENEQLQAKVRDLESAQARTNALLEQLMAKIEGTHKPAVPTKSEEGAKAAGSSAVRGASQPK